MAGQNTKSVVIVDDDKMIRHSLRQYFEGTEYRIVGEAANGMQAVELCRQEKPDIVLLDIEMPLLDGIAAAEMISRERTAKCIIMLTSFDDKVYINQAIEVGASGYLTKPIMFSTIIPTIQVCLERSREYYMLKKDVDKLRKRSESRDILNQAKLYLMETKQISEDRAYELIRDLSKKKQVSMEFVAKCLLARKR